VPLPIAPSPTIVSSAPRLNHPLLDFPLSALHSGYTGTSVKSRAAALDEEPRAAMMAQRQALLVALATLDQAAYSVQTGKVYTYTYTHTYIHI